MTTNVVYVRMESDLSDPGKIVERESTIHLAQELDQFCDPLYTGSGARGRLTFYTKDGNPILVGFENYSDHAKWQIEPIQKNGDAPGYQVVIDGELKDKILKGGLYSENRSIELVVDSGERCKITWTKGKER